MNTFEHPGYNDCVADLIDRAALNELGPGKPDHASRPARPAFARATAGSAPGSRSADGRGLPGGLVALA